MAVFLRRLFRGRHAVSRHRPAPVPPPITHLDLLRALGCDE